MPMEINPLLSAGAVRSHSVPAERNAEQSQSRGVRRDEPGVAVEADVALSAGQPPVDAERVDEIRKALEDGSYPVVPTKIADAMIAARLMLSTTR